MKVILFVCVVALMTSSSMVLAKTWMTQMSVARQESICINLLVASSGIERSMIEANDGKCTIRK